MKPTIGRTVIYNTTVLEQHMINEHPHNTPQEQSPAIIVGIKSDSVSLKVFIDGHGELYVNSAKEGNEQGEWSWPVIETETEEKVKTKA